MAEKQRPALSLSMGALKVTVWGNKRDNGNIQYSVQFSRSYRDKDEQWQQTNYFNRNDLLNIAKMAERAEEWIANRLTATNRVNSDDSREFSDDNEEDIPF